MDTCEDNDDRNGFTLIELSIVLVIIGLVIGGVLVGQDLIKAAEVRAEVTQIEKFNTAVNTFYGKYQALPGDMTASTASQFGFLPRGTNAGQGDGNGLIQGNYSNGANSNYGNQQSSGETVVFWSDLTYANGMNVNMIEGNFSAGSQTYTTGVIAAAALPQYFPQAKIGNSNYVYVYSGGITAGSGGGGDSTNYFGLSAISSVGTGTCGGGCILSTPGLSVKQAYSIDNKVDDGLAQTGRVTAMYLNGSSSSNGVWAAGGGGGGQVPGQGAGPSSTTCYDNGGNSANPMQYSMTQSGGSNINCALSFRMQTGD